MREHAREGATALADELRNVVNQAESLLRAIGGGDETIDALRARVHSSIDTARARLADLEAQASRTSERAALAAEEWVRGNPWLAVAAGAGLGLLLGAILSRGGHERGGTRRTDRR